MGISDKIHSLKGKIKSAKEQITIAKEQAGVIKNQIKEGAMKAINVPKNEIYKGVTILKGIKDEIDRKKRNFNQELSKVTFELPLNSLDWENFKTEIKKNCKQFKDVCKKGLSLSDKGKSKSYLEDIIESTKDLNDEIQRLDINNLKPSYMRTVWTKFEKLSKKLSQVSKERFITSFGEILDYKPTKTHFKDLLGRLPLLKQKMIELINTEVCKLILEDAEDMIKNKKFDKDISRNIFLIDSKSKDLPPSVKIFTRFAMFEDDKNKAGHLKQILSSADKQYFIKYKEIHKMLNDFLDNKLNQNFINSLPGKLSECTICLDEIDLSDTNEVVTLKCKHTFHKECLEGWAAHGHNTCPICRAKITI